MTQRTALITGAGGGLGKAAVVRLVADGWTVFAADIDEHALGSLANDPKVVPLTMDVTDAASIDGAFAVVRREAEQLDALVNFAGVMGVGSLTDIPEERLARILDINVMGTYRVNKKFLPMVRQAGGRIINVSSETGWQTPAPFNGPYAMSKFAIEAYSHALRRELALLGVRVITIQPGPFRTDMVRGIERAFDQAESETTNFAQVIRRLKKLAAKQIATAHPPEVLADAVLVALTAKNPKAIYSVRPDRLRSSLEKLPLRAADQIYLTVLRRAGKDS